MSYKTLQVSPTGATILPGALVRREQTSAADHSTPERAKVVTDAITQQVRELAAGAGIFKRAKLFVDIPCTAGGTLVLRHAFMGRANWIAIDWTPTGAGNAAELSRDPAPIQDANEFLSLYTPNAGTVSLLVF